MKTLTKLFVLAVIIFGFSATSFGQAYAPTSAMIITPISISNTAPMNFGNIAVNATDGTVKLGFDGTRQATDGVTIPAAFPGTVTAAAFKVQGNKGNTYSISVPTGDFTITGGTSGSSTMTVKTFVCSLGATGTLDGTSGEQIFTVGATLLVSGGQEPGEYKNTTGFPVSVNYN